MYPQPLDCDPQCQPFPFNGLSLCAVYIQEFSSAVYTLESSILCVVAVYIQESSMYIDSILEFFDPINRCVFSITLIELTPSFILCVSPNRYLAVASLWIICIEYELFHCASPTVSMLYYNTRSQFI